ncbi:MAG: hypothetical protein KIT33_15840 [Candidatus Kapabacteria bacterium]|nr:hypothetical protein [Ignavibacteriota bacterium]MCW5886443.1 hypothetical protein [Candidatus Kapabacteria bacterium]
MAKEKLQDELKFQQLADYKSFLDKALHRVKSGTSFDNYITSELLMREKLDLLDKLKNAEIDSLKVILEEELKSVKIQIKQELS